MKEGKARKDHKHKKHSKKKRDKAKKRKKDSKKSRKRASSSSYSSSSDSDRNAAVGPSALSQLERERAAVQAARFLLATQPGIRKDFRDLLWELDNDRSVGVCGISDDVLRAQLQFILQHLGLQSTQGQYWLPSGVPSTLSVIGFVFDEQPPHKTPAPPPGMVTAEAQSTPQQAAAAVAEQRQAATDPTSAAADEPSLPRAHQQTSEDDKQRRQQSSGLVTAAAAAAVSELQHAEGSEQQQQELTMTAHDADLDEQAAAAAIGPTPRRVVGPAAPSAELLAAAAAYHADMEAAGGYEPEGPDSAELLIGPPPPEYYTEADAAAADVREQHVLRVLQVLRSAAAAGQLSSSGVSGAAGGGISADPYAVLDVDPSADSGTIRKTYWRLSLLVHPDKCSHPAAQEVFQAVSKAAQMLQDTQQRKQLDDQREDAQLRQQALAAAAAAEREVAWRKARGEAVPPEIAAALAAAQSAGAGPAVRESWMTDLPTNQGKTAAQALAMGLSQTSQTSFSRFGVRQPGDTSGWTDTPQQRAMRAAGLLTDSSTAMKGPAALPAAAVAAGEVAPVNAELAAAMRDYAQQHRQKSLLEQHAERQAHGTKKKHKEQKPKEQKQQQHDNEGKGQKRKAEGDGRPSDADWSGKHPWRPWDRDKDMEVQLQRPKAAAELLKAAGNLSSRFSSGR